MCGRGARSSTTCRSGAHRISEEPGWALHSSNTDFHWQPLEPVVPHANCKPWLAPLQYDARRDGCDRNDRQSCRDQLLNLRHLSHLPSLSRCAFGVERPGGHFTTNYWRANVSSTNEMCSHGVHARDAARGFIRAQWEYARRNPSSFGRVRSVERSIQRTTNERRYVGSNRFIDERLPATSGGCAGRLRVRRSSEIVNRNGGVETLKRLLTHGERVQKQSAGPTNSVDRCVQGGTGSALSPHDELERRDSDSASRARGLTVSSENASSSRALSEKPWGRHAGRLSEKHPRSQLRRLQ